jgi:thioesterase domain-containing protein
MQHLTAEELKQLLHTNIPLSKSMGVEVIQAEPSCAILAAPLQPNINHQGTVFGGSANALAILSAYSLLFLRLYKDYPHCDVLIQQNSMQYQRPLNGDMVARCE